MGEITCKSVGQIKERPHRSGQRAESGRNIVCQRGVHVVERIAQRDNRLGISGDAKCAVEEQGIAIGLAVDHPEQRRETPGDADVMAEGTATVVGRQLRSFRVRLKQQQQGQIIGIDQEALLTALAEPGKQLRASQRH